MCQPPRRRLDRAPDRDALEAYRSLFPALAALRPARTGIESQFYVTVALHADAHEAREDINSRPRSRRPTRYLITPAVDLR